MMRLAPHAPYMRPPTITTDGPPTSTSIVVDLDDALIAGVQLVPDGEPRPYRVYCLRAGVPTMLGTAIAGSAAAAVLHFAAEVPDDADRIDVEPAL